MIVTSLSLGGGAKDAFKFDSLAMGKQMAIPLSHVFRLMPHPGADHALIYGQRSTVGNEAMAEDMPTADDSPSSVFKRSREVVRGFVRYNAFVILTTISIAFTSHAVFCWERVNGEHGVI